MAPQVQLWAFFLHGLVVAASEELKEASLHQFTEAVLSPSGRIEVSRQRSGMMRRDESSSGSADGSALELHQERHYGVLDESDRREKMQRGTALAQDPWHISGGPHVNKKGNSTGSRGKPWHEAPKWAAHEKMPQMPACQADVSTDMGLSDYGRISHSCSACQRKCTEKNKQQAINISWLFDPPLHSCNAFDVQLYANWSNIDQLACKDCEGKGIRHAFHMTFGSNAGEGSKKNLGFEGWMGPEVTGGPKGTGSDFQGLHVFEVEDTLEPAASDDCKAENPAGRWLAIPGAIRAGETFKCERFCKPGFDCKCGRNTGMRCTAGIAMSSSQVFAYRIRSIAQSATGTLDGNSYVGTEWEVTAEDLSQQTPVMTVGRVILAGNAAAHGIKDMKSSHQHIGCVPCDLFYESTVVTGPFIHDPKGVHVVRSAEGKPPPLTSDSCELFRLSSLGGFAVKFETGPGLWPPFEVNDTIFTCGNGGGKTQCPAR